MRILIYLPNFGPLGGIERHLINTIVLLYQHGCSCTLMTISNSMDRSDRTRLQSLGVRLIEDGQPQSLSGRFGRVVWVVKQCLKLKRSASFDIIYTNATGVTSAVVWFIGSQNTRVIHHHHTSGDADERRIWSRGYSLVIKQAPELIACSKSTAQNLQRFREKKPIKVLYYLTDEILPCSDSSSESRITRNKGALVIGYFGRVIRTKGIDWIVKFSSQPEFQMVEFHIHGSGAEYSSDFFAPFPNIHYFGPYLTASEQARRLRSVDCVILPSTHVEGMPLSLLEAMSAGKPWVATDRGGVKELAVSAKDCIVTAPTLEDFKVGLLQMMNHLRQGLTNEETLYDLYRLNFSLNVRQKAWLAYFGVQPH